MEAAEKLSAGIKTLSVHVRSSCSQKRGAELARTVLEHGRLVELRVSISGWPRHALLDAVSRCRSLRRLEISCRGPTDDRVRGRHITLLAQCASLEKLCLRGSNLGDVVVGRLCAAAVELSGQQGRRGLPDTLRSLDVSGNGTTGRALCDIAGLSPGCRSYRHQNSCCSSGVRSLAGLRT